MANVTVTIPAGAEHVQTSPRRPANDPSPTPGATPDPAAPAGSPAVRAAGARRTPPRPQRWATAVAALLDLQEEYCAWLDNLPTSLGGSRLAEKLQIIVELDLEELQAIETPRGYGRD